jgi:hypothetical protein
MPRTLASTTLHIVEKPPQARPHHTCSSPLSASGRTDDTPHLHPLEPQQSRPCTAIHASGSDNPLYVNISPVYHLPVVAFFVHCRHFSPVICRSVKRGMRTSDCFVWCFEMSATPVLPPFPLPFGTIHQTKETFSMVKCPHERWSACDI